MGLRVNIDDDRVRTSKSTAGKRAEGSRRKVTLVLLLHIHIIDVLLPRLCNGFDALDDAFPFTRENVASRLLLESCRVEIPVLFCLS